MTTQPIDELITKWQSRFDHADLTSHSEEEVEAVGKMLTDLKIARLMLIKGASNEEGSKRVLRHVYTILAIAATALVTWVIASIYFQLR